MGESRTNDERCCAVRNSWFNNPFSVNEEKGIFHCLNGAEKNL